MKPLNEKELAVFCGFAVLGAPDPISGETSVTLEERKAIYRALRLEHFEVAKDEFEAVEAMYDQGMVTIDTAVEQLKMKKPAVQQKIYKAVYNSVKVLAGGSEEKMARGDRRGALDELKEKLALPADPSKAGAATAGAPKKKSKMILVITIVILAAAAGAVWFLKFKH